jgi:hypothetical protein
LKSGCLPDACTGCKHTPSQSSCVINEARLCGHTSRQNEHEPVGRATDVWAASIRLRSTCAVEVLTVLKTALQACQHQVCPCLGTGGGTGLGCSCAPETSLSSHSRTASSSRQDCNTAGHGRAAGTVRQHAPCRPAAGCTCQLLAGHDVSSPCAHRGGDKLIGCWQSGRGCGSEAASTYRQSHGRCCP